MDYAKFQVAVIEIASDGTRLTLANVVARLGLDLGRAEQMLDRMAREGRLDLEVDETEGVIVYHVRGLEPRPRATGAGAFDGLRRLGLDRAWGAGFDAHAGTAMAFGAPLARREPRGLPRSLRRSVAIGVLLGAVFPGAGLAYAAPWSVVIAATLFVWVGFQVLSGVTVLLAVPFVIASMVISAILGGLYTHRYNQTGRREGAPALQHGGIR